MFDVDEVVLVMPKQELVMMEYCHEVILIVVVVFLLVLVVLHKPLLGVNINQLGIIIL